MIFFSPFFLFLLLERSLSLASSESSLFAVTEELDPCASSFTCAGGGSVGSAPVSVAFNSLVSAGAFGVNSFASGVGVVAVAALPNGEPLGGVASEPGAPEAAASSALG